MKIMITGYRGYLGSDFVKKYNKNYEIVGFDHKDGEELLNYETLAKKMQGCEQVVHLAEIPKPVEGKSFEDYINNNVRATLNVVKVAVENKLKRVIYASSTT